VFLIYGKYRFRQTPGKFSGDTGICSSKRAEEVLDSVTKARLGGIARIGAPGLFVLNSVVGAGKADIVVYAGTNVMAAVSEMGIKVATYPISAVIDFGELKEVE